MYIIIFYLNESLSSGVDLEVHSIALWDLRAQLGQLVCVNYWPSLQVRQHLIGTPLECVGKREILSRCPLFPCAS